MTEVSEKNCICPEDLNSDPKILEFQIDDLKTNDGEIPKVIVKITEVGDGSVVVTVSFAADTKISGDLTAFWFDIPQHKLASLSGEPYGSVVTFGVFDKNNPDVVTALGPGLNLEGQSGALYGSGGGYDVGVLVGVESPGFYVSPYDVATTNFNDVTPGNVTEFSFKLNGNWSVDDFKNSEFGVRIQSAGECKEDSYKLYEKLECYKAGSIEGTKYYDADRDGKYDHGEKGVGYWKISLYKIVDGKDCYVTSTYTDGTGAYKFDGLEAGDYKVVEHDRKGWEAAGDKCYFVSVEKGEHEKDKDFFNYKKKACIDIEKLVSVDGGKTWWDADCKTGPAADKCDKILYKIVVKNTGDYDLCNVKIVDKKLGINVTLDSLKAGESWSDKAYDHWKYGQQTNTAKVTAEVSHGKDYDEAYVSSQSEKGGYDDYYDYYKKTVSDSDDANYYGIKGVCDTKYWVSKVGKLAWDGKSNPKKYFLPKKDLLQDTNGDKKLDGLRVGDLDFDGKQDKGETTKVYSKSKALKVLTNKKANGVAEIEKALVTAWLNMLNGNAYDDGDGKLDECEPGYWIDQAVKYIKACGSKSTKKAASWKKGIDKDKNGSYTDDGDIQSGQKILAVLKKYNKDGSILSQKDCDTSLPEKGCDCDDQAYASLSIDSAWA